MFECLIVKRYNLVLDGKVIGKRYAILYGESAYNAEYKWDVDISNCKHIEKFFGNGNIKITDCQDIVGRVVDGMFVTRSEWGVVELEDLTAIKKALKDMSNSFEKYLRLRNQFSDLASQLRVDLKRQGISWMESQEDLDKLSWSCRFIGGFGAWSSSGEDICDAEVLDNKVGRVIDNVVKEFRKSLDKNVELHWQTGEKAWCYFEFSLKKN